MSKLYKRILLTGAAGALGRQLRPRLKSQCEVLRVSDLGNLGNADSGEEVVVAQLQDRPAVLKMLEGVDAVVHLGGLRQRDGAQRQRCH
jgi:uronate dehydrogenase